jgi:hypothetical protein
MQLSHAQVEQLTAALAPVRNEMTTETELRLQDWAAYDLEEHLARATPAVLRLQNQRLAAVAAQCRTLAACIDQLDVASRHELEAHAGGQIEAVLELPTEQHRQAGADLIRNALGCLATLAGAADRAATLEALPGHQKTVVGYLVLLDLAAIFEHATGSRAERMVHGPDHADYKQDYGRFWEFGSIAWRIVFGSSKGLSSAFKRWAHARDEYGEVSAVIENIRFRRPAMANS